MPERAAGLLLEREVTTLTTLLSDPGAAARRRARRRQGVGQDPGVIEAFQRSPTQILIGGAMAFPFLRAQGHEVGASLCADEDVGARAHGARVVGGSARATL